jgi:hypothetical protein
VKIDINSEGDVTLSDVFLGVGIQTDLGLFGIAQRDGGITVLLDGKEVWTSHELAEPSKEPLPVYTCDFCMKSEPVVFNPPTSRRVAICRDCAVTTLSVFYPKDEISVRRVK